MFFRFAESASFDAKAKIIGLSQRKCAFAAIQTAVSVMPFAILASVFPVQGAIISASREEMLGGTLYLVGYRTENHDYEEGAAPCLMCRKMIINAGIEKVVVRVDKTKFDIYEVSEWIKNDEFLNGQLSY